MIDKYNCTLSVDGLVLIIKGLRQSQPYVFEIPSVASKSRLLKIIFWYFTESDSFKALAESSGSSRCKVFERFFKFLNASDGQGNPYITSVINVNGELSDDFKDIYDNYLIRSKHTHKMCSDFKQDLKTVVLAFTNEHPYYRSSNLYTSLVESIISTKVSYSNKKPKPSAGMLICLIATFEQQKNFESKWFKSFVFHLPLMMQKIREEAKKIEHVQNLLKELEENQHSIDQDYWDFVKMGSPTTLSNEYIQKAFIFIDFLLKNGSEFLVDCVYHSLQPKLFDDHKSWKALAFKAPLMRYKPSEMGNDEWLDYKRNALNVFKRKQKSKHGGDYVAAITIGGKKGHQIGFIAPFPFCLENLVKPIETEYLFLRYLLGWHQFTELEHQNNLSLKEITPFDDGVIRIFEAYKSRTGDVESLRGLMMEEFTQDKAEYKVFTIYRELLRDSYEKYPSLFEPSAATEQSLFSVETKRVKFETHGELLLHLFEFVPAFGFGNSGREAKSFYDLYVKWYQTKAIIKTSFEKNFKSFSREQIKKLKKLMVGNWRNLKADEFVKMKISGLSPNSFRLSAQGVVQAYAVQAGRTGAMHQTRRKSDQETLGSRHAHTGVMDLQYLIFSRNPRLAESESVFGNQVASEMIGQARGAWIHVITPLENELQNQLKNTDVWSIEDLREYLGVGPFEEIHTHRNESEEARNYLLDLLDEDNISPLEGYGHQVMGVVDNLSLRQIIIDTPLTCFLMKHQINYLDQQIDGFLNKKMPPNKDKLDSITVKALVTRAFFSEIVETKFSQTTRNGAEKLLKEYRSFPAIQL